jgi:hypothetical protein
MPNFSRPAAFLLAAALATPVSALAAAKALDAALDCSSTGHDFIAPLLAAGDIQTKPMHVEDNSVNAFRTAHPLTAYGFPVFVALGYQANDPIFERGDGKPIGDWSYGVVVRGAKDAVEAKVREAGSQATVRKAFPFLTAIVCTSP